MIGQNDPCPCESGKRYRKCCGRPAAEFSPIRQFATAAVLRKYKWLPWLDDALSLADQAAAQALAARKPEGLPMPVCGPGCSACCSNASVPVTELEIRGISWFLSEVLDDATGRRLEPQMLDHANRAQCPFVLDGRCAVYPVRPLVCRQYYVVRKRCELNEHVDKTRPDDVLAPGKEQGMRIAALVLRGLGYGSPAECEIAAHAGALVQIARPLHTFPFENLVKVMRTYRQVRAGQKE